jgi:hypothetical protein
MQCLLLDLKALGFMNGKPTFKALHVMPGLPGKPQFQRLYVLINEICFLMKAIH